MGIERREGHRAFGLRWPRGLSRSALISRSAIDSGFSWTWVSSEGADVLEQALAELGVVGVDLAGTLGAVEHQLVLAVGLLEQVVDRRIGDADRQPERVVDTRASQKIRGSDAVRTVRPLDTRLMNKSTNSSQAVSTSVFTIVTSNSDSAASSSRAVARRRSRSARPRCPDRRAGAPAPPSSAAPGTRAAPRACAHAPGARPAGRSRAARDAGRQVLLDRGRGVP